MDELATAAGAEPAEFRLAHLDAGRFAPSSKSAWPSAGASAWGSLTRRLYRLACGTEKARLSPAARKSRPRRQRIAARVHRSLRVRCDPESDNLLAQVQGAIPGSGAALREAMEFVGGDAHPRFSRYPVPARCVPPLDIQLLDRRDLPSAGAGETPIIAIAPAIANAVFAATGVRIRSMPIRDPALKRV
jgi:isoquinoline 1-oxidoreductase